MDKYFTVMVVPEKEKKVRSFKIPSFIFRSSVFVIALFVILIGIIIYDYTQILQQVYENRHLSLENRQLKDQIQLFQMKINTLTDDINRIQVFEKKLRTITGLEEFNADNNEEQKLDPRQSFLEQKIPLIQDTSIEDVLDNPQFLEFKNLYNLKIAQHLGVTENFEITQRWLDLANKSFQLASDYALFDYRYQNIKIVIDELERDVHQLDQYLLDKQSIMDSTPTIIPTNGWVTSYYGSRVSPYSGRVRMHEGIDVGAAPGQAIVAPADGMIVYSGQKSGFGNFVQIDHGYGIETIYAHSKSNHVKSGQKVKRGDLIAKVGSTGHSTGPHLHYEVRVNGIAVDPLYFILNKTTEY